MKLHRRSPDHPTLWVRGSTDIRVYDEVVVNDDYGVRALVAQGFSPRLVFDIGANVGAFVRVAAAAWPLATIVAVEADQANADVLDRNVADIRIQAEQDRIRIVRAALMPGCSSAVVYGSSTRPEMTASRFCVPDTGVAEPPRIVGDGSAYPYENYRPVGRIAATTMRALVAEHGTPDFIKLDCEGGEVAWLSADDEAFPPAARIAGEWHDRNGAAAFRALLTRRYPERTFEFKDCGAGPNRGMFSVG